MKNKTLKLANVELASITRMQNKISLGRIARLCVVVTAVAVLPAHQAIADADDKNQQILPYPTLVESTVPSNGDV